MQLHINHQNTDVAKAIEDWKSEISDDTTIQGYDQWIEDNRFRYCYHSVDWTSITNSDTTLFSKCVRCGLSCEIEIAPCINATKWDEA